MKKIPSWWREPNTRHPRGRYTEVGDLIAHRPYEGKATSIYTWPVYAIEK
jgi:hypothetical protein